MTSEAQDVEGLVDLLEDPFEALSYRTREEAARALLALQAENERLREALRPLAETKIRQETVVNIHTEIIATTGNGPFADHVEDLLTVHAKRARALTGTEGSDHG